MKYSIVLSHRKVMEVHSMTIDEALEEMNTLIIPRDGIQDKLADAYDMSIASLEAWEKVRQEIGKLSLSWEMDRVLWIAWQS